jgi:hypothetical protein
MSHRRIPNKSYDQAVAAYELAARRHDDAFHSVAKKLGYRTDQTWPKSRIDEVNSYIPDLYDEVRRAYAALRAAR